MEKKSEKSSVMQQYSLLLHMYSPVFLPILCNLVEAVCHHQLFGIK